MPRVISYTRFSSRRQAKGDSYRRQTDMALTWCRENGLELDTSLVLEDLGTSAYSGANAQRGALGVLQMMCLNGDLERGTILLIEAFDRLTRLPLPDAYELLLSLVNNGLTIITLNDRKVWTKSGLKDFESFMLSLVSLYKGFQESDHKADRLQKTFKQHRDKGSKQAFGSAPGWLYREDKFKPWQVNDELAESVRKVFHLSALGYGSKAIAKEANGKNWPVPTRLNITNGRWHAQMAGQLLRSRAVLGEHEHRIHTHDARSEHWQGRRTGIVIPDYYPRIVSDELWHAARASIDTRAIVNRRDNNYYNIFAGLLYCGYCGAPMQRKHERNGKSKGQISCSDRLAGVTKCPTSAVNHCDWGLLDNIYAFNSEGLGTDDGQRATAELAVIEAQLREKNKESERIADAIAKTGGSVNALIAKAQEIGGDLTELAGKRDALLQAAALATGNSAFDTSWVDNALEHIYKADSDESRDVRVALHLQIARLVETIWIWGYEVALIKYKNDDVLHCVPLPHKQLPSRANPEAKYHKPPKPRAEPPKPHLVAAFQGKLIPPEAKKRWTKSKPKKPYILDLMDNETGEK